MFLCLLFLITGIFSLAQGYDPQKVSKQVQKIYQQAIEAADEGRYRDAITLVDKALSADKRFVDGWLSRAGLHGQLRDYPRAVADYERAILLDSVYSSDYQLPYSINLAGTGQFQEALTAVERFLQLPNLNENSRKAGEYRRKCYRFALQQEKNHPIGDYEFTPENLGDSINSMFPEYFPSLTIDQQQLVFTRQVGFANEDFFGANAGEKGQWSAARPLPGGVNTDRNEGAQNISQDGKVLVFTSCDAPDGQGSCDLYYSLLTRKGWSAPINIGDAINTRNWESQPSIAPDKRALYFSARRPDGYGGSDLYVCYLMPDGKWGPPLNMGPKINTSGNETSPFIHADNQTLYFGSDGLDGYGRMDLFLVRKDSSGHWGTPQNLGYPINTIDDEATLFVTADGQTAYYASDRSDSRGALDLYKFSLRDDIRPVRTLWIKGKVFDEKTRIGLPSAVELKDLRTGQRISKIQTDEEGYYLITLPTGKDYAFTVNRKGYLFYTERFPLAAHPSDSTYTIDIPLKPIEAAVNIVLKNIFFETGKHDLKIESEAELDILLALLQENPSMAIRIKGHTDAIGADADNLQLSERRARAVMEYLISKGIDAGRLSAKGFGETQPVADNNTEEGRAKNRRTEVEVTRK